MISSISSQADPPQRGRQFRPTRAAHSQGVRESGRCKSPTLQVLAQMTDETSQEQTPLSSEL